MFINCFRTGDISILQVDAVVNPTNETMDDNSPMCQRIFSRAGSALKIEIFNEIKGLYFDVWLSTTTETTELILTFYLSI